MLVIRLQRTGRENVPTYRLVVAEHSAPVKGTFLEIVGTYLPARNPIVFKPETERITHWISKGAVPSDTVARLLTREGMKGLEKFIRRYSKKRPRGEAPPAAETPKAAATAPAEAPATPPAETPAVPSDAAPPAEGDAAA
jgi:small subunit ribosomal protein S16